MKGLAWFLLLAAAVTGCAADRARVVEKDLQVQELQGRVTDLEQRVAFEVGEKEALAAKGGQTEASLAACQPAAEAVAQRASDLERRLRQCEESEGGGRADLDLCRRGRAAAEEQRDALRVEAEAAEKERDAEAQGLRKEVEDCRGRLAGAETQAALALAEKRKRDLEAEEKTEEVRCSYDRLLSDVKVATDALRQRVAELEAARGAAQEEAKQAGERLALLSAEVEATRAEKARQHDERARLREALAATLGQGGGGILSLREDAEGVAAQAPLEALFAAKTTDLRPTARDALQRLGALVQQADLRVGVVVHAPAAVPADLLKRYPTPWELSCAYAAKIARFLEKEGGVAPERLAAEAFRPRATETGAGASVTVELEASPPPSAPLPSPASEPAPLPADPR